MENTSIVEPQPLHKAPDYVNLKFKKPKLGIIVLVILVVALGIGLFFAKGLFVVAMVNGSPVSRLSVVKQLEQQGGKAALESLIDKKLIEAELKKQNIVIDEKAVDEQITTIETQIVAQGSTLEAALMQQNMTEDDLREQITIQKKLEKLLADKIVVSDADVNTYITDNKIVAPKELATETFKQQVKDQLKQQRFQQEAQAWLSSLKEHAKITHFITY